MMSTVAYLRRISSFCWPWCVLIFALCAGRHLAAQDTPLLSGGVGFFTNTTGGNTSYTPVIEPVLVAPIGSRLLLESKALLLESFTPKGGGQDGYTHSHFTALRYLQGDFAASSHLTVIGGSFLVPFGTYNERLTPIWISNFQDQPLSASLGQMSTGTGLGGQLRGSLIARPRWAVDYASWFSARSENEQFHSERSSGARVDLYLPPKGLEIGASYGRLLQGAQEDFVGAHVWWETADSSFHLRSEFDRGAHAHGYWTEASYRLQAFGGADSIIGRLQPVFRMQQIFRRNQGGSDNVPLVDTQQADFGLDYNLPHEVRILTSYSRQFSSRPVNIWETGIVYRFLFPAWKGRK
jgi:hypothetical protein